MKHEHVGDGRRLHAIRRSPTARSRGRSSTPPRSSSTTTRTRPRPPAVAAPARGCGRLPDRLEGRQDVHDHVKPGLQVQRRRARHRGELRRSRSTVRSTRRCSRRRRRSSPTSSGAQAVIDGKAKTASGVKVKGNKLDHQADAAGRRHFWPSSACRSSRRSRRTCRSTRRASTRYPSAGPYYIAQPRRSAGTSRSRRTRTTRARARRTSTSSTSRSTRTSTRACFR